jgi:hypothetical protein
LPDNNCCAIHPPEALRAANRKTGIFMPENQNRYPADTSSTLSLSTIQPTSCISPFRLIPGLENTLTEMVVGELLQPLQLGVNGDSAGEIGIEGGSLGVRRL